ncbi:MAG TPA: ATP-binding protein, partial [Lachnospiraceae bacterium]|nr:ATP-binding protein [Lachnospiraceae bacterium]
MVTNTIQYGFKDQKEHFIDIKVQAIGEGAKLRIRDDGAAFNPMDYLKEQDSDDLIHNIGIRMVKEIAKEVDYRNTMRMNNL